MKDIVMFNFMCQLEWAKGFPERPAGSCTYRGVPRSGPSGKRGNK